MEKFIELFANLFDETDINVFTPQNWKSGVRLSLYRSY